MDEDEGGEQGLGRDNDPPLADREELLAGAPKADEIPVEFKADEILPTTFSDLVALQSPVKNQASRGVCSIFAVAGLMEHLYRIEGSVANPDFSEQYLQWSAKVEVGSFPNTSGSNASYNLEAISEFGIPAEAAWPYEPAQWGASQDAACAGDEGLPTRCYTNGEPPQAALDAPKFFLPASRWLSRSDIKAHMFNRRSAVVVGFDFFYQSWNHRRSTLPINTRYWDQGYVLYPNDRDKQVSREHRAGHAVLLVGWDDTLEVPVVDENGAQVLDSSGQPRVERGFYIFKNSWGTGGFGLQNPFGPGYGYISQRYIDEFGSMRVTDVPVIEARREVCDDGVDNDGDERADCDDTDCAEEAACQGDTGTEVTFDGAGSIAIPDNDPAGVSSPVEADRGGSITRLTVQVGISHSYRGDLRVSLHRGSEAVVLHDRAGGSADDLVQTFEVSDFNGQDLAGEWRLVVVDLASQDTGTLDSWSLSALIVE
ncbi:MAG TPA: proprotein convertase P-domain-containing protein [Kofleriaceae bacterium]|nr:proprotein convertase P-domain-containing protein [Kofleriaceae bacterium]